MSYLRLTRSRIILACFVISSVLLVRFSAVDLWISSLFFDHGFHLRNQWWATGLHTSLTWFLWVSVVSVLGLYAYNRFSGGNLGGIDGRKVLFLSLVLVLGSGVVVNLTFKDHFGRARPRDIQEFGGTRHFTPAFVIAHECDQNCSFSSGDGAGAFFSMALALALSKRRSVFIAGVGYASLVAFSRIASGAHFFSDTVVSFFVMLIFTDVLYHYLLAPRQAADG
jgi:lipid A 4'-phosphatase